MISNVILACVAALLTSAKGQSFCGCNSGQSLASLGLAGCNSGVSQVNLGQTYGLGSNLAINDGNCGQSFCGCNSGLSLANLGLAGCNSGISQANLGQTYGLGNNLAINDGNCGSNIYVGTGGGLGVYTYSPMSPNGVSVSSDNAINGPLDICGGLPVFSAVGLEGQLPSSGSSGVQYSCGNGVGITASDNAAGLSGGAISGASGARLGYGASQGFNAGFGRGLGCGCCAN